MDANANAYFKSMIKNVKSTDIVQPLPTFKKVLNQITYLESRENYLKTLNDEDMGVRERSSVIPHILRLNSKIDV